MLIENKESEFKTKKCSKCGDEFPATTEYFAINKNGRMGLDNRCKKCVSIYLKEYTAKKEAQLKDLVFDESITKACDKCNQEKPATPEFFNLRKDTGKLRNTCRDCTTKKHKEYYYENQDELLAQKKDYYYQNPELMKQRQKEKHLKWKEKNADLIKQRQLQYLANKEHKKEELRKWKEENQDIIKDKEYAQYRKYYLKHKTEINKRKRIITNQYNSELVKWKCTTLQELGQYQEIRQDPNNPELGQVQCVKCLKWINVTNMKVRSRMGSIKGYGYGSNNFFCSQSCIDNCVWYNQSLYPRGFVRNKKHRPEQYELRKMVLERDDYECQICGKGEDESELHCHHIEGINFNPIESADVDACITLCKTCHKQVHKLPNCNFNDLQCK